MKVSLNTIKQYVDIDLSIDELVKKINEQLGGVEEVIDLTSKYQDAVIVKIVECNKHPNADRLSVCKVDDGGRVEDIERDERGFVQVVCGAPNVHADMLAVWLPPRATVPSTYATDEPFVLDARDLRGVMSNGMLAAADELALGSDHSGIIELIADEWNPNSEPIVPGASFAKAYGLDDTVIDIENKMFTHRPDCFGQIGVAREIAGITGQEFREPTWHEVLPAFGTGEGLELSVQNQADSGVPRWLAVAIKDITIEPSPLWLQCELIRLGSKPINNIVDITNYIMLLTGQPLHAYDYDKVGSTITARYAREGETVKLINGKTYTLVESDIVITDGVKPIGLGGVMGGFDSEVSDTTKNIILECANFDMYTVRKTSMRHGVFTDAVTRYNKGQSSLQQPYIIDLAMKSIFDTTSGVQASDVFDVSGELSTVPPIHVSVDFINERLGSKLTSAEIITLLERVSIDVTLPSEANSYLEIAVPYWRTDLELPEDVVEEVGRLYGFDLLPRELPRRSTSPAPRNSARKVKHQIRTSLSRAGANEVLTYSFVHEKVIARAEQNISEAFQLSNALSPDLQYYRLSVLPSLLDKVHMNIKAGYDEFLLFEIGKGHNKLHINEDEDALPGEYEFVDGVYASRNPQNGAAYYHMRTFVDQLGNDLGLALVYKPVDPSMSFAVTAPFDLTRTAFIETADGIFIGIVGEPKQTVKKAFKLPDYTAAFSLDLQGLEQASGKAVASRYRALSRYPSISQDISLKTAADISYATLLSIVLAAAGDDSSGIQTTVSPVSIYQSSTDLDHKTTTFHVEFTSYESTLREADAHSVMERIATATHEKLSAERI